ncbi:type II toxin-antitoxin system RelE/ParE family toxin [Neolewinella antarctica]|uniref:Plasmid stabilization system protein ParE n=1 Tax=Neolewinella antarctica TaxID=442734 RepID=A0ABX0XDY8_9BACT|nr:type II toxin-antitoxin system RelE/ParE family toxin [Neolewinella antarctica]NJC27141.1 plasmid stabilization system protein ParE [Neolewinella antarctica]
MKKYQVKLTPRASNSINEIVRDLHRTVNPGFATKIRKEIITAIKGLATFPEAYQQSDALSTKNTTYRRALTSSHKVVFIVKENTLEVIVVQVYHQSRGREWIDDNV